MNVVALHGSLRGASCNGGLLRKQQSLDSRKVSL